MIVGVVPFLCAIMFIVFVLLREASGRPSETELVEPLAGNR